MQNKCQDFFSSSTLLPATLLRWVCGNGGISLFEGGKVKSTTDVLFKIFKHLIHTGCG